ncbi:hypothetical protein JL722_1101 [Aureococcus anophagefferens]|nr:hypothetical protein JL722_1101 [Aureococcus anophagefferens]
MVAAARAALLGAALVPRLSAETIQEHLLELGKQPFEVRSQEWVTSTLDDDVFGDNFGTNPDFSYDDPRNYPVSRDFENPRHACFEDDAAFPWNFENLDLIPAAPLPRYNKLRGGGSYANEGFEVRHKHCELGWADLWKLGDKYDEHGTIYVTDASIVTRDARGTTLGYPPIHIHHIHIGPQPGVRPRTGEYDCGSLPKPCNNVSWFFEWHGDYECDGDEGGADCLYENHLLSFYKFMLVSGDVRDLLDERFNLAPLWKRKFYGEPGVEDLGFKTPTATSGMAQEAKKI